ncbi:MAG: O-antigen ligase family protein [Fervidobacterium sp.]
MNNLAKSVDAGFAKITSNMRYKLFNFFLSLYILLSGFVFIEPSPAEYWFTIFLPFLLINFSTTWEIITSFVLIFFPMIISTYIGLAFFDLFNYRFFIIDIYLFVFFLVLSSYAQSFRKNNDDPIFLDTLTKFWSLAGAINILVGILAYTTGNLFFFGTNVLYGGLRLKGFFKDPNVLGPFLVPITVYYLDKYLRKKGKIIVNLSALFFFTIGVLLTFSRAAWLNYFTSTLIVVLNAIRKRSFRFRMLSFTLLALFMFGLIWIISDEILLSNVSLKDFFLARLGLQSYDTDRFAAQRMFDKVVSQTSVIFGAGPGNYEHFSSYATHSLFARYIGERGIFGFVLLIFFFVVITRKVSRSRYKLFLISSLVGQLVNSFFIDSLHWRHLWVLLSLVFLE